MEIAPGPARLTVDIAPVLERIALFDASAEMLHEARRRLEERRLSARATFVRTDAFQLPLRAQFDLVYTFRFIRHFERDDRLRLYRQMASVLRPGGWLVFDAVNERASAPLRAGETRRYAHFDALLRPDALADELRASGFEVVSLDGVQRRSRPCGHADLRRSTIAVGTLRHGSHRSPRRRTAGVDRDMPPRVTYWTGTWIAAKEAISKEVNALRVGARSGAPVVSFAPGQATRFVERDRALCLSGRAWPLLRAAAAVIERRGDVTHIFGGQFSWHLFRALGRRPILLTAVAPRTGDEPLPHMRRIARVAIEADAAADEWVQAGVPRERVELVPPGVDLDWTGRLRRLRRRGSRCCLRARRPTRAKSALAACRCSSNWLVFVPTSR